MKRGIILLTAAFALASCSSTTDPLTGKPQVSNTAAGAGIGAAVGAIGGLLIAKDKSGGDRRKAALIGAGVGALVGGGIGAYMDKQEQELRQQLLNSGVSVSRNGNEIILNMPSNVTFATDQDALNAQFFQVLDSVAIVLNKYPKTLLDVDGHTDSTGDAGYNQQLSERRAVSVARYLNSRQVDARRLQIIGFGETRPIADNATEIGRAANRRVEVRISPIT
ncbi:MAG: OmpA family protein [Pseudomonadota bacterium]